MENKAVYIKDLFSRIAKNYDGLNDVMTGSLHRQWKKRLVKHAAQNLGQNAKVLDLCTGTGDVADLWMQDPEVAQVHALDSCLPMLEAGMKKLSEKYQGVPPKLHMLEADVTELNYPHQEFDAVTISFGLRNVDDADKCISEIYRVLKPGGYFACLDLGHPPIKAVNWLYQNLFLRAIPGLGATLAGDKAAYQYLVDSLQTWPPQWTLSEAMYDFGFKRSYYRNIMLGAISLVVAQK